MKEAVITASNHQAEPRRFPGARLRNVTKAAESGASAKPTEGRCGRKEPPQVANNIYKASQSDKGLTIEFPDDAELNQFLEHINKSQSANAGIGTWAATGRLRLLAKAITDLADACDEAGYAPPNLAKERQRYERLANQVGDPSLASAYAERAKELAKQIKPEEGTGR